MLFRLGRLILLIPWWEGRRPIPERSKSPRKTSNDTMVKTTPFLDINAPNREGRTAYPAVCSKDIGGRLLRRPQRAHPAATVVQCDINTGTVASFWMDRVTLPNSSCLERPWL